MTMYEQGELDATFVPATDIERVLDPTNPLSRELQTVPGLDVWYLAFDTKQPPFDDVKVRQALAYATDKEGIAKVLQSKRRSSPPMEFYRLACPVTTRT